MILLYPDQDDQNAHFHKQMDSFFHFFKNDSQVIDTRSNLLQSALITNSTANTPPKPDAP